MDSNDIPSSKRLFMIQWGATWRNHIRESALENRILTDPHSPNKFRVNGVLSNIDDFYQVFDVKEGDPMYVKPEERGSVW